MALEIRPVGDMAFDLYEEAGKVGEIRGFSFVGDPEVDDREYWPVEVWSMAGGGKTFGADCDTQAEALECAEGLYKELLAERRAEHSPQAGPQITVVSSPMGGQRHCR